MKITFKPWVWFSRFYGFNGFNGFNGVGVNFMEKTIQLKNNEVTFSIWDLGGTWIVVE